MRSSKLLLVIACLLGGGLPRLAAAQAPAAKRVVIAAGKIVAIDPKAGPVDHDLRTLTVMPGWIDAHDHVTWSFGADGKNAGSDRTTQEAAYASAANAWATLMAGFTTIQSVGSPTDLP